MFIQHLLYIFPIIVFLQLAIWVLYIDHRSASNRLCAIVVVLMSIETIVEYFYITSHGITTVKLALCIDIFIWGLLSLSFLYFSIALVEHPVLIKKASLIVIFVLNLPMLLYPVFEFPFVKGNNYSNWAARETFDLSSPFFIYYEIVTILTAAVTLYILSYARYITSNYRIQKQAMLVLKAFFIASFFFMPWIISLFFEFPTHPLLLTYAVLIVMVVSVYSMARYRTQSLTTSRIITEMIEHASDFTMIVSSEGIILSANKQVTKFLGFEKQELEGQLLSEYLEGANMITSEFKKMSTRATYSPQLDLNLKKKDGGTSTIKSGINAIRNQFKEILGYYIIFYGVSAEVNTIDAVQLKYELSNREKEVALLLMKGLSNQDIADTLFVSLATVKTHSHNIYSKTGTKNKSELRNLLT